MQLSVLVLPLLGGYLFCRRCEWFKYSLDRRTGYDLFFTSAVAGVLLWGGCYVVLSLLVTGGNELLYACLLAFAVGWPLAKLLNFCIDEDQQINSEVSEEGDVLELLLRKSYTEVKLLLITIDGGKVYIGRATQNLDPYGDRAYFRILKFASGYRNDEGCVVITTRYEKVLQRIGRDELKHLTARDFHVIVPKSRLAHASVFDVKAGKYFDKAPEV